MFSPTKLIEAREKQGLTRTDFIFALNNIGLRISAPTLSSWETGKTLPDPNKLETIARFFKEPIGYFFE